jgi:hypothetical protein
MAAMRFTGMFESICDCYYCQPDGTDVRMVGTSRTLYSNLRYIVRQVTGRHCAIGKSR